MEKEKSISELNEEEDEDFDLIKTFKETYEAEKQKIENDKLLLPHVSTKKSDDIPETKIYPNALSNKKY